MSAIWKVAPSWLAWLGKPLMTGSKNLSCPLSSDGGQKSCRKQNRDEASQSDVCVVFLCELGAEHSVQSRTQMQEPTSWSSHSSSFLHQWFRAVSVHLKIYWFTDDTLVRLQAERRGLLLYGKKRAWFLPLLTDWRRDTMIIPESHTGVIWGDFLLNVWTTEICQLLRILHTNALMHTYGSIIGSLSPRPE